MTQLLTKNGKKSRKKAWLMSLKIRKKQQKSNTKKLSLKSGNKHKKTNLTRLNKIPKTITKSLKPQNIKCRLRLELPNILMIRRSKVRNSMLKLLIRIIKKNGRRNVLHLIS